MHIGIFIHSQSGHSSAIGLAVTQKLRESGHEVDIELIRTAGRVRPLMKHVELMEEVPDMAAYDAVIFGGPILAHAVSPVIVSFIKEIPRLKGKKALCFTTSGFPTSISGARGGLKKLSGLLQELEAIVCEGEPVYWGFYCGKKRIEQAADRIRRKVEAIS